MDGGEKFHDISCIGGIEMILNWAAIATDWMKALGEADNENL